MFDFVTPGYKKVFSHDLSGGLFTSYAEVGSKNPDNPDSKLFSILNQLETYRNSEGKFQLKLCYPELTWGKDGKTCNEWIQSSNPYTDSTITGFEAISLAFDKNGDLNEWKGLGKNSAGNDGDAFVDDTPSNAYWYSAIGAKKAWYGGIPGPRHSAISAISKVELYVMDTM